MATFVANYIKRWAVCQQNKTITHSLKLPILPIRSQTSRPFQQISLDFITDLPNSKGFNSVLVIVDHGLMKAALFHSCLKTATTEDTAEMLHQMVYQHFRLMDIIILNRGPQFSSHLFQALGKLLHINLHMSTTYHSQIDGQTEWTNQTLEVYLQIFCEGHSRT